ncbi:hypothetical protein [Nocardioides campestrisoli]|uniref:hypothetical protein n=1 Tax=Nocardioides campestrisoli TaxID=2736757 RepID=UPI00163DD671|nr:hypothetical protein [Nocardioides campestrisoli]
MHQSVIRRTLAAGASAAVAVTGLAAFAAPASAQSAPITFNCNLYGGLLTSQFTAVADTNVPATVATGSSTAIDFTATITVPVETATTARALGSSVSGTAKTATTIDGAAAPATATFSQSTGTSGPLEIKVAGKGDAPYVAATAGTKAIKLAGFTATLALKNDAGTVTEVPVDCTAVSGADTTVDTFTVADGATPPPPPAAEVQATKTKATATYKKKAKKAVVKVSVANADGTAAAGDVKVVMKKGKKKFKSTVTLNAKGKGKAAFKKVAPGKYKLTVKYTGSDASKKSQKKSNVKIK